MTQEPHVAIDSITTAPQSELIQRSCSEEPSYAPPVTMPCLRSMMLLIVRQAMQTSWWTGIAPRGGVISHSRRGEERRQAWLFGPWAYVHVCSDSLPQVLHFPPQFGLVVTSPHESIASPWDSHQHGMHHAIGVGLPCPAVTFRAGCTRRAHCHAMSSEPGFVDGSVPKCATPRAMKEMVSE